MTPHIVHHNEPDPQPPVDDGPEDNWGGWRAPAALFAVIRDLPANDPAWDVLRAKEADALPTCTNHPGRATAGGFGDDYYCSECVGWEIRLRGRP